MIDLSITYHAVLTIFNVYISSENTYVDVKWTNNRLNIFEEFTLKSIKNQSNCDFEYIVFFCKDFCDDNAIKRIKSFKEITPIFLDKTPFDVSLHVKPILLERSKNKKYIITSNLDGDDIIHPNYIQNVHNELKCSDFSVLYFNNGYFNLGKTFFKRKWLDNQTHSLMEKRSNDIVTCLDCVNHGIFWKRYKDFAISVENDTPMWIWYIHNNNMMGPTPSAFKKIEYDKTPISTDKVAKQFYIDEQKLNFYCFPKKLYDKKRK